VVGVDALSRRVDPVALGMRGAGVKERPIIFSGPMVRAIIDGRKIQTRRVVKTHGTTFWEHGGYTPCEMEEGDVWTHIVKATGLYASTAPTFCCQYGQPGDRLWVRETFSEAEPCGWIYRADCDAGKTWKPSIFMPRAASRITLEIARVRVERLHEIEELDARLEGVEPFAPDDGRYRDGFQELWDSINEARGFGWDKNPWVWVIEFKKL
jgi:hypothetical protein